MQESSEFSRHSMLIYTYIGQTRKARTQNGHRNGHLLRSGVTEATSQRAYSALPENGERACARGAETKLDSDGVGVHGGQNVNVYAHFSPAFSKRPRERFCHRGAVP